MTAWADATDWDRYRPAIAVWGFCCGVMGIVFGLPILRHGSPVTPELYGSAVYSVPALAWCVLQISAGTLAGFGAALHRPLIAALGLTVLLLEFFGFGVLAEAQTQGGLVVAASVPGVVITGLSAHASWSASHGRK